MRFYADTLGLPDSAYALLRDLIRDRTGLLFEASKRGMLADRLSPLVVDRGFSSFLDYYYLLKYGEEAEVEWGRVIDALTVQETYFWREMDQVRALVDELVPRHVAEGGGAPIRIWSAACASGEEPLTIAMALSEAGWLERAPVEIVASDASPSAIEKARLGVYPARSLRNLPDDLRAKYFLPDGDRWRVVPELHARIMWQRANLANVDEVVHLAAARYIFCRNVFLYFAQDTILETVERFYERMPLPAYLFVGVSESLIKFKTRLELEEVGRAFVYVKR